MAVTINGTTGVAVPLGSASAPAETNTTSSTTGIYYPTSTTLGLSTNGTNAVTIDASQNVGIGTTSPSSSAKLNISSPDATYQIITSGTTNGIRFGTTSTYSFIEGVDKTGTLSYQPLAMGGSILQYTTNGSERMRIDSSGGVRIATTANIFNAASSEKLSVKNTVVGCAATFQTTDVTGGYPILYLSSTDTVTASQNAILFYRGASSVGSIGTTASATTYNTSSDYRLKENVAPITTGLATVSALKPVTYDWVGTNENGEGFIAHELQEVIPLAVTGEKDAVNEDGSIKSQGVDYSKIVVHLVAAIKELSAEVEALKAKVGA